MGNYIYLFFTLLFLLSSCDWGDEPETDNSEEIQEVPILSYRIIKKIPHDINSFTEGLFIHDGQFYESTGGVKYLSQAKSLFGILDTSTGKIDVKVELDKNRFFGEGIALLNNKIYQLTYRSRIGFVYDANTYKELEQFSIPSIEGWGLTTNGSSLIMSDGTNRLSFLNADNLILEKQITVSENGYAVDQLNELEYINGYIYANIYTQHTIVKIDPESGEVVGKMDLTHLYNDARSSNSGLLEMNGIAYSSASNKLYVTGKFWPTLYELALNDL